jgi:hypothetical protein
MIGVVSYEWDLFADEFEDLLEVFEFVWLTEHDRFASGLSSTSTTDTMHI